MAKIKNYNRYLETYPIDSAAPEVHAWLAGIYEGEGSIGFYTNGATPKCAGQKFIVLTIGQKHRHLADTLTELVGFGCITQLNRKDGCVYWRLSGHAVARFLKYILPHMRIPYKREQALKALSEFCVHIQGKKKTFRYTTPSGKQKYAYAPPKRMLGGVLSAR